ARSADGDIVGLNPGGEQHAAIVGEKAAHILDRREWCGRMLDDLEAGDDVEATRRALWTGERIVVLDVAKSGIAQMPRQPARTRSVVENTRVARMGCLARDEGRHRLRAHLGVG